MHPSFTQTSAHERLPSSPRVLCLRFKLWTRSGLWRAYVKVGEVGGGLLIIPPSPCYSLEPCRPATLGQSYIWQERTGDCQGKLETRAQGPCRETEWRVQRCRVHCTVLAVPPFLGIIRSMNISLITAEKAERSRVEDVCHTALSAHITRHARTDTLPPPPLLPPTHTHTQHAMSPALHISPSPFTPSVLCSPTDLIGVLTLLHSCSFFYFLFFYFLTFCSLSNLFTLHCLHHSFACVSLCHLFLSLLCPSLYPLLPPLFSSRYGWIETFCLQHGMLFLPYWPTNRKELSQRWAWDACFFRVPAMSACQPCVCVCVCLFHTWVVVVTDRGVVLTCHPALSHWRTKLSH